MRQLYSMIYPHQRTSERYETDNVIVTSNHLSVGNSNSPSGNVQDILFDDRISGINLGYTNTVTITYEFKNNIKVLPLAIHFRGHGSNHSAIRAIINTYCYDKNTEQNILLWTNTLDGTSKLNASNDYYDCNDQLNNGILTSKIITTVSFRGVIDCLSYDFEIDKTSNMVKNKVEHVIMQNELFQKVTSPAEIISD